MRAAVVGIALGVSIAGAARADDPGKRENALTGDGRGYSAEVVAADVGGALAVPVIVLPGWSSNPWIGSIPLSGVPAALSGPIVHAIHGRWIPAVASFLGWSSVVATAWATGGVLSMAWRSTCVASDAPGSRTCTNSPDHSWLGVAMGIGVGVAGAALMTALDAWMARAVDHPRRVEPSAWVTASGAGAGLGGAF